MTEIDKLYGRLTITGIIPAKLAPKKRTPAIVDCQCGTKGKKVTLRDLRSGATKSCGCHRSELAYKKLNSPKRSRGRTTANLFHRMNTQEEVDDFLGNG